MVTIPTTNVATICLKKAKYKTKSRSCCMGRNFEVKLFEVFMDRTKMNILNVNEQNNILYMAKLTKLLAVINW